MAKVSPPDAFDFSTHAAWPAWKQRFLRFRTISKLDTEDEDRQVSTLLYSMGPDAETVLEQLTFDDPADATKWKPVTEKLDVYFQPTINVIHQRCIFETLVQQPGQTVEEFVSVLHSTAKYCQFADKEERIRDRLVAHMLCREVSKELQLEDHKKLTLASAVQKARQHEQVTRELQQQRSSSAKPATPAVHAARAQQQPQRTGHAASHRSSSHVTGKSRSTSTHTKHTDAAPRGPCPWCAGPVNHKNFRSDCPANDKTCSACKRLGHFAKACKQPKSSGVRRVHAQALSSETDPFIGAATTTVTTTPPWTVTVDFCDEPVLFKIDTGADTTVITQETYSNLVNAPPLQASTTTLSGADGKPLATTGQFTAVAGHKGTEIHIPVTVLAQSGESNLLSRDASTAMGMVQRISECSQTTPTIGCMLGEPAHITLADDAKPYNCATARRVPLPMLQKVKDELQRMQDNGIIKPVTEPTDWCAPIVPVLKPNGSVRICVDLKRLNAHVKRENFPLPTVEDTLSKLGKSKIFSTLDTNSGFWQIPLSEESAKLTAFITPFGRYHFCRLPFGITSAPEVFQQRLQNLLADIPNVEVFIDDIIVHAATQVLHDGTLDRVKARLHSAGLTLNPNKCQISKASLRYLGHLVTSEGVRPDPKKLEAIQVMPTPTNVEELRRALGVFTYLSRFLPDMATIAAPLRLLLRASTAWTWDMPQEKAFAHLKTLAASAPCLAYYDLSRPTLITADASSYGMGGALMQSHNNEWVPVAYASRTFTPAEVRYAQIEKELLASVWCCEHFRQYVYGGANFTLHTDHKPLIPLINTRDLGTVPLRCQRLLIRLLRYNVHAVYVPGKDLTVADALSRAPVPDSSNSMEDAHQDTAALIAAVTNSLCSPAKEKEIISATADSPILSKVLAYTQSGWPRSVSPELQPYFNARTSLSQSNNVLYHGQRMVIPSILRKDMLDRIHTGHQGINRCKARAQETVWWPGITQDIHRLVMDCYTCTKQRYQPPEPLQPTTPPERPWQRIAADLCQVGQQQYLVVVDYLSRYLEVIAMSATTTQHVIKALRRIFATHGNPDELVTDNGPQFASDDFAQFNTTRNIAHRTSSPYHAQSNGAAERAVQTAKKLIKSPGELDESLQAYRSTPLANGYSPAQLLFGRQLRTTLPCTERTLTPKWPDLILLREKEQAAKEQQAQQFDKRHRSRPLPTLKPGDQVFVTDLKAKGRVKEVISRRSYLVQTPAGEYRRNRYFLKVLPDNDPTTQQPQQHAMPPPEVEVAFEAVPQQQLRRSNRPVHPPNRLDL